ncbi:MAG: HPF/RaiA family ribosome-associated protein [Leptolyngbya sp. SIO4C1]|nr:HPF/RaiA family ribosome-associated protein [Leptolyngbya sp. SIO4C1]
MQIFPEVSYRDVEKTDALETLIQEKVSKLEQVCDHINSCRIAIEKVHDHPSSGSPYRVRLDITVPPGHELAVDKSPDSGVQYIPLEAVIRDAFDAARRQLSELNAKQHNEVKQHPQQAMMAIVTKLFPEENYGFLKTLDGQEVYFHRNSVTNADFERLEFGTGVHFMSVEGEKGLQASTVRVVNKPGASAAPDEQPDEQIEAAEEVSVSSPEGWQ